MSLDTFNLVREKMEVFIHLRLEKHGDNNVNAYDAKLTGNFSNSILLKLHPELRDAFYKESAQVDVEGFKKELRFPRIAKATHWDLEIPRTLLQLHDIPGEDSDLVLGDGKTDGFVFDMLEGGTVKLSLRVKLAEMSNEQVSKLLRANGQTIPVSLECAALEENLDNFEQAELITQEPKSAAREEAESLFSKPPTDMAIDGKVVDGAFDPNLKTTPQATGRRGSKKKELANIE